MNAVMILLIVLEVICNVAAQMTMKIGMTRIGTFNFNGSNIIPIGMQVLLSPWIMGGILIYVLSLAIWLMILSRVEVSIAYPLTSLGYVLNVVLAYIVLSEPLTLGRVLGVMVILVGVTLVARS